MFYGMVSSEALSNPLVLNDFTPIKVIIDYKNSDDALYWHRYLLKIEDEKIDSVTKFFAPLINEGWYSVFWDDSIVFVVFKDKIITLKKEENWRSDDYLKMKQYAVDHNVEERYIDFNERFTHYKELLSKYNKYYEI